MLRNATRFLAGVGLLALTFGGAAKTARADFVIEVSTSGGYFLSIDDNGLFDTNPTAGQISVDTVAFNQDLSVNNAGFSVAQGFGASTNALDGSGDLATLAINGQLTRTNNQLGSNDITFLTRSSVNPPPDYGYNFPGPGALVLHSEAGGSSDRLLSPFSTTFQSTFTDAAASSTSSSLLVFNSVPYSGASPDVVLGTRPLPFDLSSTLTVTLTGTNDRLQFSGATNVRAIPEPGSIALLMVGGAGLVAVSRRRRAVV